MKKKFIAIWLASIMMILNIVPSISMAENLNNGVENNKNNNIENIEKNTQSDTNVKSGTSTQLDTNTQSDTSTQKGTGTQLGTGETARENNTETVRENTTANNKDNTVENIEENTSTNNTTSTYKAIYLDPWYGDDQNDGLTDDKPVKTFIKAKELAKADKNINTIYVAGNIIVETVEEFSLEGTNAILKRNPKHKGYLFWIKEGSATFKNITIDGNSENATIENSLIFVGTGTSLNIEEGAVLQNNHIKADSSNKDGGAIYSKNSVINMKNGIIQNNKAQYGSAIYLNNSNLNMTGGTIQNNEASSGGSIYIYKAKINLSGGTIQSNKAKSGAGIYLYQGANIEMTGGTIQNNESTGYGSAIYLNVSNLDMSEGIIQENNSGSGGSIYINKGKINLSGGTIQSNKAKGGAGIYLYNGANIEMTGGTIKDNKATEYGSAIYLNASNLNMSEGIIQGNNADLGGSIYIYKGKINLSGGTIQSNKAESGGGIYLYGGANIEMTGGIIQDNEANRGGGIYLNESNMNMSNGEITKNLAKDDIKDGKKLQNSIGGGICIDNNSTLNLSDKAIISHNSSERLGGGISVGIFPSNKSINTLNMNGGLITKNSSITSGGGIYVAQRTKSDEKPTEANTANILAGEITYNHVDAHYKDPKTNEDKYTFGGGGIYVNGTSDSKYISGLLKLEKAIITENYAKNHGGGYAACPSASGDFYLKDGVAIYNNKTDSYGQEIYFKSGDEGSGHSGNHKYSISPIMLGDIPYNWKFDYKESSEAWLDFLTGELDPDIYKTDRVFLKTDVKENPKAEKLAKVLIAHNTSDHVGGGIGSNGTVRMGEADFTEFKVKKEWKDNNSFNKRPSFIEVELYYSLKNNPDEKKYVGFQYMKPKDNKWEMSFKNLPRVDSENNEFIYSIKERKVKDYSSEITGNMKDGFVLTNKLKATPIVPLAKRTLKVNKTWLDSKGEAKESPVEKIEVELYKDGVATGKKLELNKTNNWTGAFTNLEVYESLENQKVYEYTVKEVGENDSNIKLTGKWYKVEYTGSMKDGYTITNKELKTWTEMIKPTRKLKVSKSWLNQNGEVMESPVASIEVELYKNGEATGKKLELNAENNWTGEFTNLEVAETLGSTNFYQYTVKELGENASSIKLSDKWYKVEYTGSMKDGFMITNKELKPWTPMETPTRNLKVSKTWLDTKGEAKVSPVEKIEVELYRDGVATGEKLELNKANNWTGEFTNLQVAEKLGSTNYYNYTIKEVGEEAGSIKLSEKWYNVSYSGNMKDGYSIVNKEVPVWIPMEVPTRKISVSKEWLDQNGEAMSNPVEKIEVELYRDGVATGEKLELNKENNWTGEFTKLKVYESLKNQKIYEYTVKEVGEKADSIKLSEKWYKVEYTGTMKDSFVITNKELRPWVPLVPATKIKQKPKIEKPKIEKSKIEKSKKENIKKKSVTPKTGDEFNILLYAGIISITTGAVFLLENKRKKSCR